MGRKSRFRKQQGNLSHSHLELTGRKAIQRFTEAIKEESWFITLLELGWTAGPVTLIALVIGYYVGFGTLPPMANVIYFFVFTACAGALAIVVRIISNAMLGAKRERIKAQFKTIIDKLPDLTTIVENLYLSHLDLEQRKTIAATKILQNSEASIESLSIVMKDLTKSKKLSDAIKEIEMFRKHGMISRVNDTYQIIAPEIQKKATQVEQLSPKAAKLMLERYQGVAPSKKEGVERTTGFIERILAAGEQNNFDLMTAHDVIEIFSFAFESINDRKIFLYHCQYRGKAALRKNSLALEKARKEYRSATRRRNNRLNALVTYLIFLQDQDADLPYFMKLHGQDTIGEVVQAIDEFAHAIKKDKKAKPAQRKKQIAKLKIAVDLYNELYRENKKSRQKLQQYLAIRKKYLATYKKIGKQEPLVIGKKEGTGLHINIKERSIHLSANQRAQVIEAIAALLKDIRITNDYQHAFSKKHHGQKVFLEIRDYKKIAYDIALAIDEHIDISNPDIQNAIEISNKANLQNIEVGASSEYKAGSAAAIIKEVQNNAERPITKLLQNLLYLHQVELTKDTLEFLEKEYDISRETLDNIVSDKQSIERIGISRYYMKPLKKEVYQLAKARALAGLKKK